MESLLLVKTKCKINPSRILIIDVLYNSLKSTTEIFRQNVDEHNTQKYTFI